MSYFQDSPEWQWLFSKAVNWDDILPHYISQYPTPEGLANEDEVKKNCLEILTVLDDWAEKKIAPRAPFLDQHGSGHIENGMTIPNEYLQELYREAAEIGLLGVVGSRDYGAMDLPIFINMMAFAFVSRGCLASSSQLNFFSATIDMLERFCSKEDCARLIPLIVAGKLSGSMTLTESDAGSDIGALTTRAVRTSDGSYRLSGNKIFITNAGGGLSFALARTEGAPSGIKGISLFLVEQTIKVNGVDTQNYRVLSQEKKLGMRGSFTCSVAFENSVASLIGKENEGLPLMFHLMNQSRIGVGTQAIGIMEACLQFVKGYAQERVQFGRPLMELPLFRHNFHSWETELNAFRAFFVDSLNTFSIYHRLDLKRRQTGDLNADESKKLKDALSTVKLRTPLIKYYGAELAVDLSKKSIQALGGYGLMEDYPVERWHRDSFGPLLYEGTSQIQSLMVTKDLVKGILKNPREFFASMIPSAGFSLSAEQRDYSNLRKRFFRGLTRMIVKETGWVNESKIDKLLVHSEEICEGLSYLETLKVLADHAAADDSRRLLFQDYQKLIQPRLAGILESWK